MSLLQRPPTYENWVLVYITRVDVPGNWVDGFVVGISKHLKDKGYDQAGSALTYDWHITAANAPRVGLAYFRVSFDEKDDMPALDQAQYVWLPPL